MGGDDNRAGAVDASAGGNDNKPPYAHCGTASSNETATTTAETAEFSDSAPPKSGMEPEDPVGEKNKYLTHLIGSETQEVNP